MNYKELTSIQLDALREVSNIGAGNSATALSVLLGSKIDMSVPNINIIGFEELFNQYEENEVVAVLVKVLDDIEGSLLYVFETDSALNIISRLCRDKKSLDEMGASVIAEVGNIIASSFMNAISNFINIKATVSVPAIANDMLSAILVSTFVDAGQYNEYILDIETLFSGDDSSNIKGNLYYVPAPGSLEKILESLGIG
ncbi:chemotaxis protein CheC [Clostridium chauvoei]|uniref:Chemotaxis protein CheC n=2 Tax=Clostridium chauvoei TaxID=46867 RepID=A0ABD4RI30_9CLOT|nr:chemotaxis protein CheC [Clostridium chauvoei]ATD54609.1 CheY-P-specific phosphatase CheC [Clostridium chauvoei]ATD57710.1 CheY-P-specific phosphatase CheC [Clostridium chauvoei]MBX7281021.1 chemotaxis protein CheC [Clostridium chauvoei]MBX7283478.1 chemotaxis protein CheC [Clostridium chauvoei]MBX7286110.1 chemotaxis protein CheC [Clostridium chauvoei]